MPYYEVLKAPWTTHVLIDETAPVGDLYFGVEITAEPLANPSSSVAVIHTLRNGTLPEPLVDVLLEALHEEIEGGGQYGFPLINIRLAVTAVEYRETTSNENAIRLAASKAFQNFLVSADLVLITT
jgi:elongation factor G